MKDLRGDLRERGENKATLREGGMGKRELRCAQDLRAHQQQIEIQGTRPFGRSSITVSPELALDGKQVEQQIDRTALRPQSDDRIQEVRLLRVADWLALVQRGLSVALRPPAVEARLDPIPM